MMVKQKNHWSFRKEISLGTLIHVIVLLTMVTTTWNNLQKELALIRHELSQLKAYDERYRDTVEQLHIQVGDHEIRMRLLETQRAPDARKIK